LASLEVEYRNKINEYESRLGSMTAQMEALRNAPARIDVQYMDKEVIVPVYEGN